MSELTIILSKISHMIPGIGNLIIYVNATHAGKKLQFHLIHIIISIAGMVGTAWITPNVGGVY